jgi:hypothetical protein
MGQILGDFFKKLIWSPWMKTSFFACFATDPSFFLTGYFPDKKDVL